MSDFTMKANDTLPSIAATLSREDDPQELNLTGATVHFVMRGSNAASAKLDKLATIVNAEAGQVRYDWAGGDTQVPGEYRAEWEVTFSDGSRQTFPTRTYHTISILADLNEV